MNLETHARPGPASGRPTSIPFEALMNRMRAVIVDDEPLARRGIRQLLREHADVEIAGEARNGKEAVRLLKLLAPDLVFLDVQMPECDGFDVLAPAAPSTFAARDLRDGVRHVRGASLRCARRRLSGQAGP